MKVFFVTKATEFADGWALGKAWLDGSVGYFLLLATMIMENCPFDLPAKKMRFSIAMFNHQRVIGFLLHTHLNTDVLSFFHGTIDRNHTLQPQKNLREAEIFVGCREIPSAPAEQH
jgi:hypothetical protein